MKNFITTLFALFFTVTIWAQGTLTGTVMDSDQEDALIGATVYLKGTNYGTATDFNGALWSIRNDRCRCWRLHFGRILHRIC